MPGQRSAIPATSTSAAKVRTRRGAVTVCMACPTTSEDKVVLTYDIGAYMLVENLVTTVVSLAKPAESVEREASAASTECQWGAKADRWPGAAYPRNMQKPEQLFEAGA